MFGIACMEELTRGAVAGSQRPRKTGECQAFGTTTCPPITTTIMPVLDANGTCTCISSGGNSIHPGLQGSELVMIESS